ncbi:hypothetical protein [Halorarum salinum]|uniref:Uncharacterized protein n=1 Tax=Halorarum salinum TaxID=2743089 RepID=A0A7D5QHN0_9EURY|nr:hypothetical protein [Halobaculum salinum]QLG62882.1 hypothetical protein HUG12_14550 [Halobaculum salinum]
MGPLRSDTRDRAVADRRAFLQSVGGTLALAALAGDAAGTDRSAGSEGYAAVQGDDCVPVVPLSGDRTVEELYDLQIPGRFVGDNGAVDDGGPYYQSNGTTDLQRPNTTITFLYDGPGGLSLVTVHDTNGDSRGEGGSVTWTVEDVPSDAAWAVKDDLYLDPDTGEPAENNYDGWDVDGPTHVIDWTWGSAGTDGGALGPLGDGFEVTVDPAFNELAGLWGEHYAEDPITDWQVLSFPNGRDDPERTSLALDRPVTIRDGSCDGRKDRDGDDEKKDRDEDDDRKDEDHDDRDRDRDDEDHDRDRDDDDDRKDGDYDDDDRKDRDGDRDGDGDRKDDDDKEDDDREKDRDRGDDDDDEDEDDYEDDDDGDDDDDEEDDDDDEKGRGRGHGRGDGGKESGGDGRGDRGSGRSGESRGRGNGRGNGR